MLIIPTTTIRVSAAEGAICQPPNPNHPNPAGPQPQPGTCAEGERCVSFPYTEEDRTTGVRHFVEWRTHCCPEGEHWTGNTAYGDWVCEKNK